jgi:hypothetical protein
MKIENLKPFDGQHCETTAILNFLNQCFLDLEKDLVSFFGI